MEERAGNDPLVEWSSRAVCVWPSLREVLGSAPAEVVDVEMKKNKTSSGLTKEVELYHVEYDIRFSQNGLVNLFYYCA